MTKKETMDIDALKAAMATLDDQDGGIVLPAAAAARKTRRSLATLIRGQIVQAGAGLAFAVAGGMVWSSLLERPGLLFASGLLVNLYGAAMIALSVAGLAHVMRIDVAAPIVDTEGHMTRLQRIKLLSGWMLGVSWWVFWLPFMAVVVRLLWGADMLAKVGIGAWLIMTLASGVAGWAGMWGLRRWAIVNGRTHLATRMDDMLTGRSFSEARRRLNEVASFAAG